MIHVAQVTKRYGAVPALDGVSLEINGGARVGFVGANGSGKTTLLRCLLGLVRFEGKITVAGSDVSREPEEALRSVAYIPQIAPPIDAPVREVVQAYAALRGRTEAAVAGRARRLGLDLEAAKNKRFRDLSGGMKQKLLAAMALSTEAPVLVCDEPTANLDGEARAEFIKQLDERPPGSIVLLCSHRIEEVRVLVDRVVELSEGKIRNDASLDETLRALRAFRVEVALRPGSERAADLLRGRGFVESTPGRYVAQFSQSEKVQVVAHLLGEYEAALADIAITPIEDFALAVEPRAGQPRLKVVS
jgi:ABC-type multidrug transport system ATPase subunit